MSAAPQSHAYYPPPDASEHWRGWVRKTLRHERARRIAAGTWGDVSHYGAIPAPASRVRDLHSTAQAAVYDVLEDIGRGKYNCGPKGGHPSIKGSVVAAYEWNAHVSAGSLAALMTRLKAGGRDRWPVSTVRRQLAWLQAKHSIVVFEAARRAGDKSDRNREATTYHLPHFTKVLAARRDDPLMGTTHGEKDPAQSLQWSNNRADSRRPLTPAQVEHWRIRQVIARRDGKFELPAIPPTDAVPVAAAARSDRAAAVLASVPECVAEKLLALCGPNDVGPTIVKEARARAAEQDKVITDAGIAELIGFIADRAPKRKTSKGVWESMVGSWSAYLMGAFSGDKGQLSVANYCDLVEKRTMKAAAKAELDGAKAQAAAELDIEQCIAALRHNPQDAVARSLANTLSREHPELYMQKFLADDLAHGGDGAGSSWRASRPPPGGTSNADDGAHQRTA